MATIFLTPGDDKRTIINPGTYTIDALGGVDSLSFGTSLRSSYTITKAADGGVRVDTISGASGAFKATLYNTEVLFFDSERDRIDLSTFFPATNTSLVGTAANDRLTPGSGISSVDGGAGTDTVALGKARNAYQLTGKDTAFSLAPVEGGTALALSNVERLQFSDQKLALDLNGPAGLVAKILGAVFGRESVANSSYVGIGLGYADGGMSATALTQLALDARLGAGATSSAVVTLLYTNVVGTAPSAADLAFYTGLLDTKAHTPGSLGLLAADTSLNLANIDLVGLANTGLLFT
jgi:hypothetical protein